MKPTDEHVSKRGSALSLGTVTHKEAGKDDDKPGKGRTASEFSQGPGLMDMVGGEEPEVEEENAVAGKSSSVIKFYPDKCRVCCGCLTSEPLRKDASCWELIKNFFSCPPQGVLGRLLLITLIVVLMWGFLFYLFVAFAEKADVEVKKDNASIRTLRVEHERNLNPAWLKGPLFALGVMLVTGLFLGVVLKRYLNLPPLLGPLILGIIYNNVDAINVFRLLIAFDVRHCPKKPNNTSVELEFCSELQDHSINSWIKPIRLIALAIILTRAGIELSPKQMKKLKGIVPLLAFGPCIVEAHTCALMNYLLFNLFGDKPKMELAMCFVGGFAIAAVSPAVVVPGALSLKKEGYGVAKGVPTLLIAASSIDDVLAISLYSISLGFAAPSNKFQRWQIFSGGAIGLGIGLIHGVVFGIILHFLPPKKSISKAVYRLLLLLLINLCSVMSYEETFFSSAGSISVIVTSFIAGFGWRSQPHWKRPMKKIEKWLARIWVLWVPLLFGTIGKEINLRSDEFRGMTLAKTFGVIGVSLIFRLIAAFLICMFATRFNLRECTFVALSWIPKATVQAALAPLVITRITESGKVELQTHGKLVVNVAILAVLISAPVGSILIALLGPKMLDKSEDPDMKREVESEFPNGEGIDPAESTFALIEAQKAAKRSVNESELVVLKDDTAEFSKAQGV